MTEDLYRLLCEGTPSWAVRSPKGYRLIEGDPFMDGLAGLRFTNKSVAEQGVRLLPPTSATAAKVLALAYNYRSLTGDLGASQEPLFFFKSPTGLVGSGESVHLPDFLEKVWVEVELALVIGRGGRNIAACDAAAHVLGYTIGNDITAQNLYGRDHHLARSKGLDGFCPLGPFLRPGMPPSSLALSTRIGGVQTQHGDTDDRILGDAEAVALVSRYVSLQPGDVILTGTPAGAMDSLVRSGDTAVLSIAGLGELRTSFT